MTFRTPFHFEKKLFKLVSSGLIMLVLLFTSVNDVKASHAMGADLTYQCIGNNQYIITFSFYRDCLGISAPPFMNIQIDNSCGFNVPDIFLQPLPSSPTQISPVCPTEQSTCNGGTYTGIQEWIYVDTITLPGQCADWTFSHSENARNVAITTITGGGIEDLYVYSTVNNLNGLVNNSPTFTNRPVPFACLNQLFCFNHGAYDVDGDSLAYQIITPRIGPNPGDTVTYLPGYSASQPVLSTVRPMTFNTTNGDFCMYPTSSDITVLAVLVNEYRNGVLIGQVERDIQVTVVQCNNNLPTLTGINNTPNFSATICAGNPFCFKIYSFDPDALNNTTIDWDHSIPNATLTIFGAHRDSAEFCWTPSSADISATPYCFTVNVADDNCPYIGLQAYAYCITVKGVAPDAGPDQTIPCGGTANLSVMSTGGDGNYIFTWLPSGIIGSNLNNVGLGTYFVKDSSAGCINYDTVQVLPGLGYPVANFGFANNCSGAPVTFTDSSSVLGSNISTWSWDFGDGNGDNSQNPTHQYASNGTYTVTLTVSTPLNCTSTLTRQIIVNTNVPVAQFSSPNVCDGFAMTFTDQSTNGPFASWSWNFNDPSSGTNTSNIQNPTHTFSAPGSYSVSLLVINTDGCQHQINRNVTVNTNPVIVVNDAGICAGSQATLNGPNGFSIYQWNSGQTSQSISISPALTTQYQLTVTDANGCVGSYTATVQVDPLPTPDAGNSQTICEGTGANLSGSGGIQYTWNPGNISGQNIVVQPASTTIYSLTVSSNAGCFADDTVTIHVNPMPQATVGDDYGICKGETTTINSNAVAGNILWTPGNFNTQSITVTPANTTTYILVVSDAIGCTGSDTITLIVNPIPVALFNNPNPACGSNSIQFSDVSNVSSGAISQWFWDFGDGQTSTIQNPVITFNTHGNYNVNLIITTDGGCKDTANNIQTIWASPVASFTHTDVCDGLPVSFTDASTIGDLTPLVYNWNLGDNTTSAGTVFTHLYNTEGTYTATLSVLSTNGCIDSVANFVNVYSLPDAKFKADYSCEDQPALYIDQSTINKGLVSAWLWSFGDSNTSSNQFPSHVYTDPGIYNIHLLVLSDHGCPDSTDGTIRIVPKPLVDFATENACFGFTVDLTDNSQPVTGSIVQYQWNFGDGTSSNIQNPTHLYATYGFFDVSLTVTSDSGCITTLQRNDAINIYAPPDARFSSNSNQANDIFPLVNFLNETVSQGFFYWNFGDGDTSMAFSPTHLYPDVGNYDVELVTIDLRGCVDTTLMRIEIKPTSNVYIPNAFTPNGDTRNDQFHVYSYNVKTMEVQIYDRWGIKIVEWKDPNGSWDGKVNGTPAQSDTYVYRVSTIDINDMHEVYVGHVSLVR